MRCVFMLASEYGLQCFDAVRNLDMVEIVGVLTPRQEYDLKCGGQDIRKMKNGIFTALVQRCNDDNIPIYVMEKMNHSNTKQKIREWEPELIIVSGWYHLIGKDIIDIPTKGVIGLHSSLLPRYRGGAPLVWQIINGEKFAGITLFYITYMSEGVDAGDIVAQKRVRIEDSDTIGTLYARVGEAGIELLKENLPLIDADAAPRIEQTGLSDNDIYPQRSPQDGVINWGKKGREIYNFVRAQTKPYPGAFTYYLKYKVIIWSCELIPGQYVSGQPGKIIDIIVENAICRPIVVVGDLDCFVKLNDYTILDENEQEIEEMCNVFKVGEYLGN